MDYFRRMKPFIYFYIFIFIKSDIIQNPIETNGVLNLIDFYISFEEYVAKTIYGQNPIEIFEEVNSIILDGKSFSYSPNLFYVYSQTNKYIFVENNIYKYAKNNDGIVPNDIYKQIPNNYRYYGFIKEKPLDLNSESRGDRCPIDNNEIILYGINGRNISFYYIMEEKGYEVSFDYNISTISCKLLDSAYYLCAFDQNNKVYVVILDHLCENNDTKIVINVILNLLL